MKEFLNKLYPILFPDLYDFGEVEGIIGGADGPTAIVVAHSENGWIHLLLFIAILTLIVTTTVLIIRYRGKKK